MSDSSKISFATIVSLNGRKLLRVSVNPLYIVPFVRQKIRLLYTSMMEFHSKNILSIRMQKLAFSLPKPTSTDYAATTLNQVCISLHMLFDVSERAWLRGAAHKFCYLYHEYIQINLFSRYRVVVSISTSYAYFLLYAYEFFVTRDILGNINISRYWKFFKYRQPNQWLYSWVSREIQALIQQHQLYVK